MTKNKWLVLAITSAVILATMGYGVSQYDSLPATMVIHWGMDNQPNGWMPKAGVIYGIPLIMLVIHLITVGSTYWASSHGQSAPRFERITAWIIPIVTIVMYVVTIRYAQGQAVNIRLWAIAVVGAVFILMGNYLPTVPTTAARQGWTGIGFNVPWQVTNQAGTLKTMRVLGYVMVAGGILLLGSLFLPTVASVVALALVIAAIIVVMPLSYVWTTRSH
ncbi:DUF1648 domain-containing protein [Lacticaseibacillus baoqingensis]|uniref:DUF1648 domain-containing protein n=1 Tax=Lacticaseibacillus baoqingensis TaxID=2486013 RepID=A0ABW4EBW4_9LACO|nr:DUF1648 domain-containing protein [Lacticaseibacillus baoqingensis]